jgi:outer membrane protein assembly factor BamB
MIIKCLLTTKKIYREKLMAKCKLILILLLPFMLASCSGFFDSDNTPPPSALVKFTPSMQPTLVWSKSTGFGSSGINARLTPAIANDAIYTSDQRGKMMAINRFNGSTIWRTYTGLKLLTGPGVADGLVLAGTHDGNVVALSAQNGSILWRHYLGGQLLASPAIANGMAVVKTIEGEVQGLDLKSGHTRWTYNQTEPPLILRAASAPVINGGSVYIGFANGKLAKLALQDGQIRWLQMIAYPMGAFAIQRMVDIDSNLIIHKQALFAATYQGKLAALNWLNGRIEWSHDISTYSGMAVDDTTLYISDAKSYIWAYSTTDGSLKWVQKSLYARNITGPASIGNYIVVGDGEGFLHWLRKQDGEFAARTFIGNGIHANPIAFGNMVYVMTTNGYLAAYQINPR